MEAVRLHSSRRKRNLSKKQTESKTKNERNLLVQKEDDVLVVPGTLKRFSFPKHKHDGNEGKIVVEGVDGKTYEATVPSRTTALYALMAWLGPDSKVSQAALKGDQKSIPGMCKKTKVFKFVQESDGKMWLFATLSERYKPLNIEDIQGALTEALPDAKIHVTKSTGRHGGRLEAKLGKIGPADVSVYVDAGLKNGLDSAHASGGGVVLACKNQLTIDVAPLVKVLPKFGFAGTNFVKHLTAPIDRLVAQVKELRTNLQRLEEFANAAKEIKLSQKEVEDILQYYVIRNRISERTRQVILEKINDGNIAQVPGTLYGLVMVATWLGTHDNDLKEGVQYGLKTLGGEMLVVSTIFDQYQVLVRGVLKDAAEKAKPTESTPSPVIAQ